MPTLRSTRLAVAALAAGVAVSVWALSAVWSYLANLPAPPGTTAFANSIALDGRLALVGAQQSADLYKGPPPNSILPPSLWGHVAHFTRRRSSGPGLFGRAVAIDGDRLAIGAPYGDPQLVNNGYVDVYERVGSSWSFAQQVKPTAFDIPPPLHPELMFGSALALKGDTLVVGAHHFFDTAGRVFVFERNGGNYQQTQQIAPAVDIRETGFGISLALAGDALAIARPGPGGAGGGSGGSEPIVPGEVHMYLHSNGLWVLQQVLVAPDSAPDDLFGMSLDLRGQRLVVRGRTAAYLFVRSNGVWTATWQHAVPAASLSGAGIALRPSTRRLYEDDLFVGDPNAAVGRVQIPGAGKVLRFTEAEHGPGFVPHGALQDPAPSAGAHFGTTLSGSGDLLLVGAPAGSVAQARARVFTR